MYKFALILEEGFVLIATSDAEKISAETKMLKQLVKDFSSDQAIFTFLS